MLPVEILPIDGTTLVLRARGSELLILPQHIGQLKSCKNPKDFTGYFLDSALLNRPARKLFEAWLRKDKSLWQRIYRTVQTDMDADKIKDYAARMNSDSADEPAEKPAAKKTAEKPAKAGEAPKAAKEKSPAAAVKKADTAVKEKTTKAKAAETKEPKVKAAAKKEKTGKSEKKPAAKTKAAPKKKKG